MEEEVVLVRDDQVPLIRELEVLWLIDCSAAMAEGGRMQALEFALKESIPSLLEAEAENANVRIVFRAITFGSTAEWQNLERTPVRDFVWQSVSAKGGCAMGACFRLAADGLRSAPNGALPPVLILLSAGRPTDDIEDGLAALRHTASARGAVRLAVPIGRDADSNVLQRFIDSPMLRPLSPAKLIDIVQFLKWTPVIDNSQSLAGLIPIIADVPDLSPGLGFAEYAEALADAICGGSPAQFTMGIYGPWGSGKSSLLNALQNSLAERANVLPVCFDAWRYERSGNIVIPLLHQIYASSKKLGNKQMTGHLKAAIASLVRSMSFNFGMLKLDLGKLEVGGSATDIGMLDEVFEKPFAEMRKVGDLLKGRRVVILIDDLDRCSPDNVVAVLESIKLVMDIPGFIFVLALDYDVVVAAVTHKYPHISGHVFIEKMVQVPFRVPRLDLDQHMFLRALVPDWKMLSGQFPSDFSRYTYDIANIALKANPRQIKRLLNSFLVLRNILDKRAQAVDYRLLAALIGLQLRWPQQYQEFIRAAEERREQPHEVLRTADPGDQDLQHYVSEFFTDDISLDSLRSMILLTQTFTPQSGDVW